MIIQGMKYLSPKEAQSISDDDVIFIDLRPEYETNAKQIRVKTLVFLNWQDFKQEYTILDPARHFIVFDEVGLHSKEIVKFLVDKGFENVAGMAGGIVDWERDGLPINIDMNELMTGSCLCTMKPKKKFKK
ncbi:MAG: rhodanese-like domain-containing protein [Bacteroidetes bacterium]|nr:rhodanese-like domain-containing protein [Bacteroidota bacterium]